MALAARPALGRVERQTGISGGEEQYGRVRLVRLTREPGQPVKEEVVEEMTTEETLNLIRSLNISLVQALDMQAAHRTTPQS